MALIVANWKMNGDIDFAYDYLNQLFGHFDNTQHDIVICPPATLLYSLVRALERTNTTVGGQDCHPEKEGAYTGCISAKMLFDIGCDYVIVGHSEVRERNQNGVKPTQRKVNAALNAGLYPIICVGEAEKSNHAVSDVIEMLHYSLPDEDPETGVISIAYEPYWAIGNETAPYEHIEMMHAAIADYLSEIHIRHKEVKILYGGYVNAENYKEILALPNVRGLMVGSASLDPKQFSKIINTGKREEEWLNHYRKD